MDNDVTTYEARIAGDSPIIMHSGARCLAEDSPIKDAIASLAKVTASKRTPEQRTELKRLESLNSLWLTDDGRIEVPAAAIRATIENAARKSKDGPAVREGLLVIATAFDWNRVAYGTDDDDDALRALAAKVAYSVPVVVQRARILRTRAMFKPPWTVTAHIECANDMIEKKNLEEWIRVAGRRIGLGDWRPQKSGIYGRFQLESLNAI